MKSLLVTRDYLGTHEGLAARNKQAPGDLLLTKKQKSKASLHTNTSQLTKAQEVSCGALCYGREDPWGIMHYSSRASSLLSNLGPICD